MQRTPSPRRRTSEIKCPTSPGCAAPALCAFVRPEPDLGPGAGQRRIDLDDLCFERPDVMVLRARSLRACVASRCD